ncbi:unnamed protein product [Effrenium voratum]|nr:unnamed protein product [Effrenium voratum]
MSFYNHAVFEVGPTRVNPVQDSNGWRERASIEACYTNRAAGCVCASPGPYRWEETPEPVQPPPRRKGKVPKDFGKEILTAGEMQRQALRPWKGIQAAGIVINANQTKPPVLPSFEVPNGKQTPALSCARTGTPCFEQVEIERQKRQRAEEEVERLRAELRACRSCASSASSKSGSRPPSRQSQLRNVEHRGLGNWRLCNLRANVMPWYVIDTMEQVSLHVHRKGSKECFADVARVLRSNCHSF